MSTLTAPGSLETTSLRQPPACRALEILNEKRNSTGIEEQMRNLQKKCEERCKKEMEAAMSNLARTKEADREKIKREEVAKLRSEFAEVMRRTESQARQRLAAVEQAEQGALNRVRQNQKDLERRAAEWHQEATRQIDETEKQQKIRAQQLNAEEQRLARLKQMLNHERETPLVVKDRNRQNDPLALEDANSPGVQRCAKEAANLEAGQEMLKSKLKNIEEKYALNQNAIADAEAELEGMTRRLALVNRDLEQARRKQELQSETIAKKEQWENATKAEIAKLKLELEVAQREKGRVKAALEDLETSSQRDRASAKNQLNVLQSEHDQALQEITNLRSKSKASASAQKAQSKLEAELRYLKEEHEQLQAELNSVQISDPVNCRALKEALRANLNGEVAARQN